MKTAAHLLSVMTALTALGGCATPAGADDGVVKTTVSRIVADPMAWSGKSISVDAILVYGEITSRLYATAEEAKKGWIYDQTSLDIRMDLKAGRISKTWDGKTVRVTGEVDAGCIVAHEIARRESNENRIVMASGYCHTADGPHLNNARVRTIGL